MDNEHLDEPPPVYVVNDIERDDGTESYMASEPSLTSGSSSDRTMSTLASSEVALYFRELHGSQYIKDDNIPIVFPTDTRADRLDVISNMVLKLCQQGKIVPAVIDEFVRRGGVDGSGARVLDLPTNSGTWVNQMADTYSNATFVSLDVKPLAAHEPHPRITFEVYDLYAGIAEPDASFDIVHAAECVHITKDYNLLLREMHRVLKPGGLILITEVPIRGYEFSDPSVPLHSAPRQAAALDMLHRALTAQGIDLTVWDTISERLEPGHPMWNNQPPISAPLQSGHDHPTISGAPPRGFNEITHQTYVVPCGPWSTDPNQKLLGALAGLLPTDGYKGMVPLLMMMGMEQVQAQGVVEKTLEEHADPRFKSYMKWKTWCARRI